MATVAVTAVTNGFSGSIGKLLFRQVYGKTIVSKKPRLPKKQSELQRTNRLKFKDASLWAKATVRDPERKAYYLRMAKKLKLPNAYTAAICDYMRKGEINKVDTRQYKGKAGDTIRVKASKKDFPVRTVKIILHNETGHVIESGKAVIKNGVFIYKTCTTLSAKIPITLNVKLSDHPSNITERNVTIMY